MLTDKQKLELYENYYKSAEKLIGYLFTKVHDVPDEFYVPYEAEQLDLVWELTRPERESKDVKDKEKE